MALSAVAREVLAAGQTAEGLQLPLGQRPLLTRSSRGGNEVERVANAWCERRRGENDIGPVGARKGARDGTLRHHVGGRYEDGVVEGCLVAVPQADV